MTAKQITKKLEAAGINTSKHLEIRKGEIEIWTGNLISTERLMNKISKSLGWGGFKCGYGGWVLQVARQVEMGSYSDKSSRWHY